ncbi:DUF3027 domain-containing protein [Nocardia crassostreae]|uniref:DUF3027 domain-containing protein n=1 Tax=Nocardia crassostreae TaxID=53428 RepID=UPI0009FC3D24
MSAVGVSEPGVRPILAEAVDLARRALLELEPVGVGAHLGVTAEDESSATHHFEATLPGYRGWQWAVVVAAPPEAEHATVSESALLPGPDALVAPDFIPWDQRIRPGDLAPGDLLAPPPDDPRLVPGYVATGDPAVDEVALELGLGRTQVLSREGRLEAADRWYSAFGPETDMARSAPATCGVCGFFTPMAGSLHAAFGVCANAMGADGHVVHMRYGCGAHSDTVVPTGSGSPLYEPYDSAAVEVIPAADLRKPEPVEPPANDPAPESDSTAAEQAESAPADSADAVDNADAAENTAPADADETAAEPVSDIADPQVESGVVDRADAIAEDAVVTEVEIAAPAEAVNAGAADVSAPEAPESDAPNNGPIALFDVDPDAKYDDAWVVTAVQVEPENGAPSRIGPAHRIRTEPYR